MEATTIAALRNGYMLKIANDKTAIYLDERPDPAGTHPVTNRSTGTG